MNELLDVWYSRVGRLELHLAATDLAALVHKAADEQRLANPERTLHVQFPTDRAVPVVANGDRIGQVVAN